MFRPSRWVEFTPADSSNSSAVKSLGESVSENGEQPIIKFARINYDDIQHQQFIWTLFDSKQMDLNIRLATEADLPAIVDIYNQSIPGGWSTADTTPISVTDRIEWFRKFSSTKRPIWVAEMDDQVVATVYLSSFYAGRPAYDATAEVSLYIASAYQRRGLGRRLKQWVIEQCPRLGITTLLSLYFDHNDATRRINESLGFEQMGHLKEIAVVQGQSRGLVIGALRILAANS